MNTSPRLNSFASYRYLVFILGVFIVAAAVVAVPVYSVRSGSSLTEPSRESKFSRAPAKQSQRGLTPSHSASLPSWPSVVLAFLPVPQATAETIETFQSGCTTPSSSFSTGDTVCAHAGGTFFGPRRIYWINADGHVTQIDTVDSNNRNASHVVNQAGKWRVYLVDATDGSARAVAVFSVSDPQRPTVDLAVVKGSGDGTYTAGGFARYKIVATNNGPDTATSVQLSETTPASTTFVGITPEDAGALTFTCTPGSPTVCTAASMAAGVSATFTFVYQVDANAAEGTIIANRAEVTNAVDELNPEDNVTKIEGTVVSSGGGNPTSCSIACPDDITTPSNTVDPNNPNQPGAVVHFSSPSGNDECGLITVDHCNDCFFPEGTTVVTATATTGQTCSFSVIVTPSSERPEIKCPPNKTADADSSCEATVTIGTPATRGTNVTVSGVRGDGKPLYNCDCFPRSPNQADDACNIHGACTRAADAPFATGETTITWTAYSHDIAGPYETPEDELAHRTGSVSCKQTITVNDVTPPTITPPPGQTASADASCMAAVPDFTATTTVTDNCACSSSDTSENCQGRERITVTQSPAPGTMVGKGQHTITLTANDGSSNNNGAGNTSTATTTFTVNDTTAPTITCPANISLPSTPGTCNASVSPGVATATDNCDGSVTPVPSRSDNKPITDPFPVGTVTIHWTATDSAGNSSSCDQTVIVTDNENPTITCPANITTNTDPGTCSANVNPGTATATDNCGVGNPPTVTGTRSDGHALGDPYPKGTTTIHWTATDSSGNSSSCDQTVTVNDNEAPAITCPAATSASADASCQAPVPDVRSGATTSDNCGGAVTVSQSPAPGTIVGQGPHTITLTATDGSGNSSTCTTTFTVNDTTPPTVSCPASTSASADANCHAPIPNVVPGATASDNCSPSGSIIITQSPAAGTMVGQGPHTITVTATDAAGNSNTCTTTFTVNDTTPPTISCPAPTSASADASCQAPVPNVTSGATTSDNCGPVTVTQSPAPGTMVGKGPHTITLTATDGSGNSSSCTTTFTVNDTTPPTISCPSNITVNDEAGTCAAHVNPGTATASDNCGSATVTGARSDGHPLTDPYPDGTTTITWTATDPSGNHSSCTQTITVRDDDPPTITFNNLTIFFNNLTIVFTTNTVTVNGTTYPFNGVSCTHEGYTFSFNGSTITITNNGHSTSYTLNGNTLVLWTPTHQYQTVNVADLVASAHDDCDPGVDRNDVDFSQVTSDEPDDIAGGGDGTTIHDIVIAPGCKSVQVRAERDGNGNGRVYTISSRVRDASGNTTIVTSKLKVFAYSLNVVDDGPHNTVNGCP